LNRISIANRGSPRGKPPPRNRGPTRHRRGPPRCAWQQGWRYELVWSRFDQGIHPTSLRLLAYRDSAQHRTPPELANAANALTIRNRRRPKLIREGPNIGPSPPKATGPPVRGDPWKGAGKNDFDSPNPGQGSPTRRPAEFSASRTPSRRK
jgi:hypothetical protein